MHLGLLMRHEPLPGASAMISVAVSWRGWCAKRVQGEFIERSSNLSSPGLSHALTPDNHPLSGGEDFRAQIYGRIAVDPPTC